RAAFRQLVADRFGDDLVNIVGEIHQAAEHHQHGRQRTHDAGTQLDQMCDQWHVGSRIVRRVALVHGRLLGSGWGSAGTGSTGTGAAGAAFSGVGSLWRVSGSSAGLVAAGLLSAITSWDRILWLSSMV